MLGKTKELFLIFLSWNTLSHLNMIDLTHTRHTQVIVEVNTPFTSLCGYLTDVNSDGVVRQPLYPTPSTLSWHALYKAQSHTSFPSNLHVHSPTVSPPPPLPPWH